MLSGVTETIEEENKEATRSSKKDSKKDRCHWKHAISKKSRSIARKFAATAINDVHGQTMKNVEDIKEHEYAGKQKVFEEESFKIRAALCGGQYASIYMDKVIRNI